MNQPRTTAAAGAPTQAEPGGVGKVALPVSAALDRVGKLYAAGRLAEAEQVCRQIIERLPKLADPYNMLAVIRNARGDPKQAVNLLTRAIKMRPDVASFHSNLGEIERQRGHLVEAEIALKKAISLDPKSPQALSNLGIIHYERKEFAEAAIVYERAIALNPRFAEAYNNLGNAYLALERRAEAIECYQTAVAHRENYAEAYNNMGSALRDLGDFESAEHAYRKAIGIRPNYMEPHNSLALMLAQQDRTDEALRYLADALRVDEFHVDTLVNVAKVQLRRGAHAIAEQAARFAIQRDPNKAEAHAVLAQIRHEFDDHRQALAAIDRAIEIDPQYAELHSFRGVILKSLGNMEQAKESILKALSINADVYSAYSNLNDLDIFKTDHALVAQMKDILSRAEDPNAEKYIPIYFALGKAHDDAGDHPVALDYFATGAKLKRALLKYDEADTFNFFDQIKAAFPAEMFAERRFPGVSSDKPIFVVGMPRSGSTLVEQILSSHPDVFGAGEVKTFHRSLALLRDRYPSIPKFPAMMKALNNNHLASIGQSYMLEMTKMSPDAIRFTDKLLSNYFFVGLINIVFPNAKIIHTIRNPVDTCLSAYTKLFKDDMPHSYDWGELGRYYLRYQDLMAHWTSVLPAGVILPMTYEDVIGDLETNARALVAHVGLEWNDACLEFHKSSRPVKTASVVQVRKPVYATSVERWRKYGDGLTPLIEALNYEPKAESVAGAKKARPRRPAAEKLG
jgi:tetratricopeptide (TPR) repeat protein